MTRSSYHKHTSTTRVGVLTCCILLCSDALSHAAHAPRLRVLVILAQGHGQPDRAQKERREVHQRVTGAGFEVHYAVSLGAGMSPVKGARDLMKVRPDERYDMVILTTLDAAQLLKERPEGARPRPPAERIVPTESGRYLRELIKENRSRGAAVLSVSSASYLLAHLVRPESVTLAKPDNEQKVARIRKECEHVTLVDDKSCYDDAANIVSVSDHKWVRDGLDKWIAAKGKTSRPAGAAGRPE